jgi:hypothetical protein
VEAVDMRRQGRHEELAQPAQRRAGLRIYHHMPSCRKKDVACRQESGSIRKWYCST